MSHETPSARQTFHQEQPEAPIRRGLGGARLGHEPGPAVRHLDAKPIAGEARAQFESRSHASVDYRVGHDLAHHQRRVLHLSVREITGGEL
jgi:hypothetical protein